MDMLCDYDRWRTTDPSIEGPVYVECLGCGDRVSEDESELDDNDLCPDCVKDKEEDIL
jgi:formylmethanofuran dehydrogenase subunit E|tara:strand:+ start:857 stop:1030 length:174 start_codon:yes stop_codon:yes gene_type:complete